MLRAIELRDFAIADAVEVSLRPGLNVLSGETGAGKSLVVDALALATGGRADAGVVREGADSALVQLHFEHEGRVVTAARRIVPEGRNVARLDGEVVTVAELQGALDALVGIFGQHAYRTLLDGQQQRLTLDRLMSPAGDAALGEYREAHLALGEAERALRRLETEADERRRRLELLQHDHAELEEAALRAGESDDLDARLATLRQVDRIRDGVARALDALEGREASAVATLAEAQRAVDLVARHAPPLATLARELREALDGAQAVTTELEAYLDDLEADPAALDRDEARRALLDRLFRKHGGGEAATLAEGTRIVTEMRSLEREDAERVDLEVERERLARARDDAGATLSRARASAAASLAPAVTETLHELALPHATFSVALEPTQAPGPHGLERIEFRFRANPGESEAALSAVASGGELSRVMLALHAVAGSDRPVLVFDEIDAGVGGRTGRALGSLLHRIARDRQVLVVTHLAQIAAFADHHLLVDKVYADGRTHARVRSVVGEARVGELARMLAGDDGPTARRHAEELLALPR
ncbi:MAG: DNA repair protein RecN [Trueperaceae bacterium]|nr:DNA repair protein RecN [Trueperaceae bacterium]